MRAERLFSSTRASHTYRSRYPPTCVSRPTVPRRMPSPDRISIHTPSPGDAAAMAAAAGALGVLVTTKVSSPAVVGAATAGAALVNTSVAANATTAATRAARIIYPPCAVLVYSVDQTVSGHVTGEARIDHRQGCGPRPASRPVVPGA